MSRIRIVKGNITKITGGSHKMYSKEDIINTSGKRIIQQAEEITYGKAETPKERLYVCVKKVPSYPNQYGSCDYYKWRFENFLQRHKTCKHLPPQYYFGPMYTKSNVPYIGDEIDAVKEWWSKVINTEPLKPPYPKYDKGTPIVRESYGYKYCVIFSNYLAPKLSEAGKEWLNRTRRLLQEYIEEGLRKEEFISKYNKGFNEKAKQRQRKTKQNPLKDVELDNDWFQEFAFATHPDAYLDAGLLHLSMADKIAIARTPDMVEWMSVSTWEQAMYVAEEQAKKWVEEGKKEVDEKYEQLKKLYEQVKNKYWDTKNKTL
ncbi:hypothetical protein [Bergeyella zoohelcum]|uniref:Uncharacterized protein n=1 Tax=Bergeyella zoohelcum TaxID=1015 RepID=A0A380ZSU4_9FLAO|nr:hypothetical protein [Bergeyella zoohelcum]EKB62061.1 hypothetical protein HMPREF9700_00005 [Bergeyella zoohelcum CCUG 30536]SUV52412.1 Uncharacterised protein [Bergeyella zoohelcum]